MAHASRRKATIKTRWERCSGESGGEVKELISARPVSDFGLQGGEIFQKIRRQTALADILPSTLHCQSRGAQAKGDPALCKA